MEETVIFLKDKGISCFLQEAHEHSRESARRGSFLSLSSNKKRFSHQNLTPNDPPRWLNTDGKPLEYLDEMAIPEGYSVFKDWFFVVEPTFTDCRGWRYHVDIKRGLCTPIRGVSAPSPEHKVRVRRWQRILVDAAKMDDAQGMVDDELEQVSRSLRSLSPILIRAALDGYEYEIQYVMESQRRTEANKELSSSCLDMAVDPPVWSSGPKENLTDDPTKYPVSVLRKVESSELNRTNGWIALHEFLFIVWPNKDDLGWEYNENFSSDSSRSWTATKSENSMVRRRVWMRPCVRDEDLNKCRDRVDRYISAHPQGIVKEGRLQRQSHYRKRWCDGTATLTDTKLEISLENNYQGDVVYDLIGCEVVSEFQSEDSTGHTYRFGLRKIDEVLEQTQGMRCILNARSKEELVEWVTVLSRQVSQVNLSFWGLPFGPPVYSGILIQGNMWKRTHTIPHEWKFRKFELHGDGVMSYWKGAVLKGKIKLRRCKVEVAETGYPFSFRILKQNGYNLVLRTSDEVTRNQWMTAIEKHATTSHSPEKAVLPAEGHGMRRKSYTEVPDLLSETESADMKESLPASSRLEDSKLHHDDARTVDNSDEDLKPSTSSGDMREAQVEACTEELRGDHKADKDESTEVLSPPPPPPPAAATRRSSLGPGVCTHTVSVDRRTGRRTSVLNEDFKAELLQQSSGIWEAEDDSDESESSDTMSRSSSFVDIHASRNKSAIATLFNAARLSTEGSEWQGAPWEQGSSNEAIETATHEVLRDKNGRRRSVLNEAVLSGGMSNGQWGGDDSDESVGESSRPSSMASYRMTR